MSVAEARYTPEGLEVVNLPFIRWYREGLIFVTIQNDRKWSVLLAERNKILTARDVPKVRRVVSTVTINRRFHAGVISVKMILIMPRIDVDPTSPHGGRLVISFPEESGCETFSVPLHPNPELLNTWEM